MKIIEAMKAIKALTAKAADLRVKIHNHCANLDIESSPYPEPAKQVAEWLQSHSDTLKEILRLRIAIQKTNIATPVAIMIDGTSVTKCIAEWVHRRRDLANLELEGWKQLTDRGLKEGSLNSSVPGGEARLVKIIRHFDSKVRDAKQACFRDEPHLIDATLEVVNATTEVV